MVAPPSSPDVAPSPVSSVTAGFAGLGRMGSAFSQRLVRAGIPLVVWNRTPGKVDPLVREGARWATSPKELAKSVGKGVTFLMLSDGPATKRVLFGRGGLATGAPTGALFVNLATIDPEDHRAFAARLEEKGIRYLEAPVGGSVDAVSQGTAMFFVGGDATDLARVRPLLEKMGSRIEPMGPVGAGSSMKLVNNMLTIGITTLTAEALSMAEGFHLDRARVIETLLAGGGRSTMLERKAPVFLSRQYSPQFSTALARKDLKLVERAASREGRTLTMVREARKLLDETIAQGRSEEDFSAVFETTLARPRPPPSRSPLDAPAATATAPPGDGPAPT